MSTTKTRLDPQALEAIRKLAKKITSSFLETTESAKLAARAGLLCDEIERLRAAPKWNPHDVDLAIKLQEMCDQNCRGIKHDFGTAIDELHH